jgi:hypothetical protein
MTNTVWFQCLMCVLLMMTANGDNPGRSGCAAELERKVHETERQQMRGDLPGAEHALRELLGVLEVKPCEDAPPGGVLTRLGHSLQLQGKYQQAEEIIGMP